MRAPLALAALALLAGCHQRSDDASAVSPEEDRMLNEAAASQDVNMAAQPVDNTQPAPQGNAQ